MADAIAKLAFQISASPALLQSGLNAGADSVHGFTADVIASFNRAGGAVAAFSGASKSGILSAFGSITGVLTSAEGKIKSFFGAFFDSARASEIGNIRRLADNLGLTTEELTGFQYAAARSGTSAESFERGMRGLERQLGKVDLVGEDTTAKLDRFGLKSAELAQMPTGKVIGILADKYRELSSPAERAAFAVTAFGKTGQDLMQFLDKGSKGLADLAAEADILGLSFSRADAMQVSAASGALSRISATFEGIKRQLVIGIAPVVQSLTEGFVSWVKSIGGMPSLVQRLTGFLYGVADAVLAVVQAGANVADKVGGSTGKGALIGTGVGAAAGSFLGPLGTLGGGALGNMIGGLFDDADKGANKLGDSIGKLRDKLNELRNTKPKLSLVAELKTGIAESKGKLAELQTQLEEARANKRKSFETEDTPLNRFVNPDLFTKNWDMVIYEIRGKIGGLTSDIEDMGGALEKAANVEAIGAGIAAVGSQVREIVGNSEDLLGKLHSEIRGIGKTEGEAKISEMIAQQGTLRGRIAGGMSALGGVADIGSLKAEIEAKDRLKQIEAEGLAGQKKGESSADNLKRMLDLRAEEASLQKKIAEMRAGTEGKLRDTQLEQLDALRKAEGELGNLSDAITKLQLAEEKLASSKAFEQLREQAKQTTEQFRTPIESLDQRLEQLEEQFTKGLIGFDTLQRAAAKAGEGLTPNGNPFTAGKAVEANSADAISIRNSMMFQGEGQEKIQDLLRRAQEIHTKNLQTVEQIKTGVEKAADKLLDLAKAKIPWV
jgi:hypothetical protein